MLHSAMKSRVGLSALLLTALPAAAGQIAVPGDFATIQAAINAATEGDEISVAPGDYPGDLVISKRVTIRSEEGPGQTTILGTGSRAAVFLEATDGDGGALVGFTVRNGSGANGGGLFLSGDVAVIDCVVTGNSAINGGGAFIVGSPLLSDVRFLGNSATNGGGVFLAPDADVLLDLCEFYGNDAAAGGALYISPRGRETTYATVGSGAFENNSATHGAAIYARMAGFEIVDSVFTGNAASETGGAIFAADGEFSSMVSTQITDGEAERGAAVFVSGFGDLRLQDCEISDNASGDGDAAVMIDGDYAVAIKDSSLWGNTPAAVMGVWEDLGNNSFTAPQLCAIDYAAPMGVIDIQDLVAFVNQFVAGQPGADLAPPQGMHDLRDLLAFIDLYSTGCGGPR